MFLVTTAMLAVATTAPDATLEKKLPIEQEIVQPEIQVTEDEAEELVLVLEDEEASEQK
jgi:hypothetical protein